MSYPQTLLAMIKKGTITEDDKKAFADAMRDVKQLAHTTKILPHPTKTQKRRKTAPFNAIPEHDFVHFSKTAPLQPKAAPLNGKPEPAFSFSDYEKLPPVESDEALAFFRSGIPHKTIRNLRKGQYNAEAVLDLHGKTVEEARETLSHFLTYCQQQRMRYLLIIHGKGRSHHKPIIKNMLNHWLRQTEQILAFCSAAAKDGSRGAVYVLLRRKG